MNITAIILAGGKSSRMGQDKGLMLYRNKVLIEYIIESCRIFTSRIVISSRNPLYSYLGYPLVEDEIKDIGPLGGIYSGLKKSTTANNLFCPCDMPGVSYEMLKKLIDSQDNHDAVIAANEEGKIFPVLGIWNKSVLPVVKKQIKLGDYKLKNLLNKIDVLTVTIGKMENLLNVNHPEDLA